MKLLYCVSCEKVVPVEEPVMGHSIIQFVPDEGTQEIFWCEGEFTSSTPDFDEYEFDTQDEPTDDELLIINRNAELLLNDFEGE